MTHFPLRQTTCFFIPLVAPCPPLLSSVDVDLLYLHFCETKENLSEFIAISENLLNEYKQGTHTKELSRKQLEEIAHLLPPKEQWGDQVFEEKRDLIIRRYKHRCTRGTNKIK